MDHDDLQAEMIAQVRQYLQHNMEMVNSPQYEKGNSVKFSPDNLTFNPNSPLAGKKIAFLGSSITYGFAAKDISFVEYLAAQDGVVATKSAISGTTLAGPEKDSYIVRLKQDFQANIKYDLFVCQLSTNDYQVGKALGKIAPNDQLIDFDLNTTIGAMEEIARFTKDELYCPLVFYTCPQKQPNEQYVKLIAKLKELQAKWHFAIIDLFNNQGLMASTKAHPAAMFDNVHPTREGYLKIWLPVFEKELAKILTK